MSRGDHHPGEPTLEDLAFLGLVWTGHSLTAHVERELRRRHQLPLSWFEVLLWLSRERAAMSVSELGHCAMLSRSQVSRVLDVLARRGLAARVPSGGDARTVHVEITERGREVYAEADATRRECLAAVFTNRLTDAELATLARTWTKLKHHPEETWPEGI
jgi:DNA-binding MarR family transcriptional regulator